MTLVLPPVILGSASPRSREILESLGIAHVVHVAAVDEDVLEGETPDTYLVRIVRAKLAAVQRSLPSPSSDATLILVADTSVIVEGGGRETILGKPSDARDALRMVTLLGGSTHEVHTRFALGAAADGRVLHEETVRTKVTFRPLSNERALAYASSGEGLDKAGGYAVQGLGAALVARIEGSYTNVVGLPACEVSVALEALAEARIC